jgi:hypothetical protein
MAPPSESTTNSQPPGASKALGGTDATNVEIRWMIIVLTLNGCGVRNLQRALHVSPNTVLKVIREEAAAVPEPAPAAPHSHPGTG